MKRLERIAIGVALAAVVALGATVDAGLARFFLHHVPPGSSLALHMKLGGLR